MSQPLFESGSVILGSVFSLRDFALSFPDVEEIAVEDATTPDEADMIIGRLSSRFSPDSIVRMKVSPVIGTNVGPRVLGIAVLPRG